MLAACGIAAVEVVRRPKVAVLSTGDELTELGKELRPGAVYDSNGSIIAAAVREAGGEPVILGAFPTMSSSSEKLCARRLQKATGDRRFERRQTLQAIEAVRTEPGCIMVNRNAGAGTRALIDRLLGGARPTGYSNQPRSHNAVAAAVAQGRADWGVAIQSVAALYDLGFLPIAPEQYDFLLVEARRDRGAIQAFLAALRDPGVKAKITALGMRPAA